jgi:hypothetical protein
MPALIPPQPPQPAIDPGRAHAHAGTLRPGPPLPRASPTTTSPARTATACTSSRARRSPSSLASQARRSAASCLFPSRGAKLYPRRLPVGARGRHGPVHLQGLLATAGSRRSTPRWPRC